MEYHIIQKISMEVALLLFKLPNVLSNHEFSIRAAINIETSEIRRFIIFLAGVIRGIGSIGRKGWGV